MPRTSPRQPATGMIPEAPSAAGPPFAIEATLLRVAQLMLALGIAALVWGGTAVTAHAVLIAGPDGTLNTSPPNEDPGFLHVGRRGALSAVYVRNGWVLTANHVGEGPFTLDGTVYEAVPGSGTQIENGLPPHPDLMAFKLVESPPLPGLNIASSERVLGEPLILVGNGHDRGAAISWSSPNGIAFDGWSIAAPRTIRWGTNFVEGADLFISDTQTFASVFDDLNGPSRNDPEAQAVAGDSGGAAFIWNGATPELAGILYARSSTTEEQTTQPLDTVLYENATLAADLFFYRDQIVDLIDAPACDNGVDDDLDGLIDFPDDEGCASLSDADEVPEPGLLISVLVSAVATAQMSRLQARSSQRIRRSCSVQRPRSAPKTRIRRFVRIVARVS